MLFPSTEAEVSSPGLEPWPADKATIQNLLNYRFPDGRSLLHLAVELQGDPEVVRILLMAGCRPEGRLVKSFSVTQDEYLDV